MRVRSSLLSVVVLLPFGLGAPAGAVTSGQIVIQGGFTLNAGFGSYCIGNVSPIDVSQCPVLGTGNTVPTNFSGTGVGQVTNVANANCGGAPACVEGTAWDVPGTATGSIIGWCEMWAGVLNGALLPAVGSQGNVRTFRLDLTSAGSAAGGPVQISGSTNLGETVVGHGQWVINAFGGSSCLNNGPKTFLFDAVIEIVSPT